MATIRSAMSCSRAYLTAVAKYLGRSPNFNEVSLIRIIPNGKADLNNRGPFSTDYIGKNYGYPDKRKLRRAGEDLE